MKAFIFLALIAACAAGDYARYENFDVDELINNRRLLISYSGCFQGGKCTPEGNDFKKWIPEAMQTSCGDCTEHQKRMVAKVMVALKEKLPNDWVKLTEKYNKDHKYDESLNKFLEEFGH